MHPRASVRPVPSSPRYFHVDMGESLGLFHFRFPSYGKAAKLVGLLSGFQQGDGLDRLVEMLDVAGYAIGTCWHHQEYDLDAGDPPSADSDGWRTYGDAVVDELQEYGLSLPQLMQLVNTILSEVATRMTEVTDAQVESGN